MKTQICLGALLCAFFFATTFSTFGQGSIFPTTAPTLPIMKTLDQVEPRTPLAGGTNPIYISQPGSYYLAGNISISAGSGTDGITVYVSNVTIDLNGFELAGSGATSGTGVIIAGGESNVTIRNGTIRNWGSHGVNGSGNSKLRAENLRVLNNGGNGILADAYAEVLNCVTESNVGNGIKGLDNCIVKNSQAILTTGNGAVGISVGAASDVTDCVARRNGGVGIAASKGSTLTNCTASYNTGLYGIATEIGCTLTNCTASYNTGFFGIATSDGCTLTNCTASFNTGTNGISAGTGSTLTNCTASNNATDNAINASSGSTLTHCTASANSSSQPASYGIHTSSGCTITECTASGNTNSNATASTDTGVGIYIDTSSTVTGCTASGNKGDGIQFILNCLISGNNSSGNGVGGTGHGFHALGSEFSFDRNRIDGNHANSNTGYGFNVRQGDLVVRNSATHNTLQNTGSALPDYNHNLYFPLVAYYSDTDGFHTSPWGNW